MVNVTALDIPIKKLSLFCIYADQVNGPKLLNSSKVNLINVETWTNIANQFTSMFTIHINSTKECKLRRILSNNSKLTKVVKTLICTVLYNIFEALVHSYLILS